MRDEQNFRNNPFSELGNQSNDLQVLLGFMHDNLMLPSEILYSIEQEIQDFSEESSPLGLTLLKTPSFVDLVETILANEKQEDHSMTTALGLNNDSSSRIDNENLKASNFPAILLRIGTWEWRAEYEGDLIAKIYYAKQKIVWEILQRPLKNKIEIQWSEISAIRAIMPDNEVATLEIELNQRPLFYCETDPQPRKHSAWKPSYDFTGGQASFWRIHYVQFAPKTLDKHYQMLLRNDERLFSLSHGLFPSQESTFFNFETTSGFRPRMQYPYQTYNTTPITMKPHMFPSDSTSGFPFVTQNQTVWGRQTEYIQDASSINSVTQSSDPVFDYQYSDYVGNASISNPNTVQVLTHIDQNHLLDDSQVVNTSSNEMSLSQSQLANVDSTYSLLNPLVETPSNGINPLDVNPNNEVMQIGTEFSISDGFCPPVLINRIARESKGDIELQPKVNSLFDPFDLEGLINGDYSTRNSNPNIFRVFFHK